MKAKHELARGKGGDLRSQCEQVAAALAMAHPAVRQCCILYNGFSDPKDSASVKDLHSRFLLSGVPEKS